MSEASINLPLRSHRFMVMVTGDVIRRALYLIATINRFPAAYSLNANAASSPGIRRGIIPPRAVIP